MKKLLPLLLLTISLVAADKAIADDAYEKATIVDKLVVIQDLCVQNGFTKREGPTAEEKFRNHLNQLQQSGHPNIAPDGYGYVDASAALKALDTIKDEMAKQPFKIDQKVCDDNERVWPLAKQYGAQ